MKNSEKLKLLEDQLSELEKQKSELLMLKRSNYIELKQCKDECTKLQYSWNDDQFWNETMWSVIHLVCGNDVNYIIDIDKNNMPDIKKYIMHSYRIRAAFKVNM